MLYIEVIIQLIMGAVILHVSNPRSFSRSLFKRGRSTHRCDVTIKRGGTSLWWSVAEAYRLICQRKWFHASEDFQTLSLHDLQSLRTRHLARHGPVLPVLHKLYISQPGPPHAPLMDDIVSFMISRHLSGHPIVV